MSFVMPRFCNKHTSQMHKACVENGLGDLIGKSADDAMSRHARGEFEPVIRGFIVIAQDILEGLSEYGPVDPEKLNGRCWICDGESVCKCGKSSECYFQKIIPTTADQLMVHCQQNGLVQKPAEA